jgi:hypothetical protein
MSWANGWTIPSEEYAIGMLEEVERQLALSDHLNLKPTIDLLEAVADQFPSLMYRANGLIYRIHTEDYGKSVKAVGAHALYR